MGMKNLPNICQTLLKHGKNSDTPVAIIHWGTTENQRSITGTLETIVEKAKEHDLKNPSVIVVGNVVSLHEKIAWFLPQMDVIDAPISITST